MSDFDPKQTVPVLINAADPGAEIMVLDSAFSRLFNGVGKVKANLPPGLYKAKFLAGDAVGEQIFEVPAINLAKSEPIRINQGPLQFKTPAPLAMTLGTEEVHMNAARRLSSVVALNLATGTGPGQIFVFIRDQTAKESSPRQRYVWAGVSIVDANGANVIRFDEIGEGGTNSADGICGMTVAVDAGAYRLLVDTASGIPLEMMLYVAAGWQTQVFLDVRNDVALGIREGARRSRKTSQFRRASLEGASIFMGRHGFEPNSARLRLSETARQALGRERRLLGNDSQLKLLLPQMLDNKFEDPMLGIYALHFLLLEQEPDISLIRTVIFNLENIGLRDHPDTRACKLALDPNWQNAPFTCPPMLSASWRRILDACRQEPNLVPHRSLAAHIAPRLVGSGPWLVWRGDKHPKRVQPSGSADGVPDAVLYAPGAISARLMRFTASRKPATKTGRVGVGSSNMEMDDFEALPSSSARTSAGERDDIASAYPKTGRKRVPTLTHLENAVLQSLQHQSEGTDFGQLAESLGVLPSTINTAIAGLLKKTTAQIQSLEPSAVDATTQPMAILDDLLVRLPTANDPEVGRRIGKAILVKANTLLESGSIDLARAALLDLDGRYGQDKSRGIQTLLREGRTMMDKLTK